MDTIKDFFKYFSQLAVIQLIILFNFGTAYAQDRAVWVTAWELNSPSKIDAMLQNLDKHKFNKIFIQSRYRGDALYVPNKMDSTFINPEKRCYLLQDSQFDPLAYTIEKANPLNIKVYAWVTTFVITPHDLTKIDSSHVFYRHPEWLLNDRNGKSISYNEYEGAFLDPSLPEVRQYTMNVICDIASNYDISGVQLDYIRYPDTTFGWNATSKALADSISDFDFLAWKQQKISSFVNSVYINIKNINPELELSAAVISDRNRANNRYAQHWWNWLKEGYLDRAYVMAYNTSNNSFTQLIKQLGTSDEKDKMTIIVRSWQEDKVYHVSQINNKLAILKSHGIYNIGYYNYSGLIKNNYINYIKY